MVALTVSGIYQLQWNVKAIEQEISALQLSIEQTFTPLCPVSSYLPSMHTAVGVHY